MPTQTTWRPSFYRSEDRGRDRRRTHERERRIDRWRSAGLFLRRRRRCGVGFKIDLPERLLRRVQRSNRRSYDFAAALGLIRKVLHRHLLRFGAKSGCEVKLGFGPKHPAREKERRKRTRLLEGNRVAGAIRHGQQTAHITFHAGRFAPGRDAAEGDGSREQYGWCKTQNDPPPLTHSQTNVRRTSRCRQPSLLAGRSKVHLAVVRPSVGPRQAAGRGADRSGLMTSGRAGRRPSGSKVPLKPRRPLQVRRPPGVGGR